MKQLLIVLFFAAAPAALGQTTSEVDVTIAITRAASVCSWGSTSDATFGSFIRPGTGTGQIRINAVDGTVTASPPGSSSGSPSRGGATLTVENVDTDPTVTITYPDSLAAESPSNDEAEGLEFAGEWAQRVGNTGDFTGITGTTHSVTAPGEGNSSTVEFRYGGTISDIKVSTVEDSFTGVLTVSITCS